MSNLYLVGVDVGTQSVRAALVNSDGKVLKSHSKVSTTFNPQPDHYEQSSNEIWDSVCECVRTVTNDYSKTEIVGIGFDATCSLVTLDSNLEPITISSTGNPNQNIMLWLDHRATIETEFINSTKHEILKYVGNKVSLEMEIPKLLWLKKNMPSVWNKYGYFFDLPDFLTFKCTDSLSRSVCSCVCKWNYDGEKNEWSRDYFEKIGLSELCENNFKKIGEQVLLPGTAIKNGLSEKAAKALGLMAGTAVATSMIDAHAGALALLGSKSEHIDADIITRMGVISGTSTCHMSVTNSAIWAPGFWGPYKEALYPNMFLMEGGQSATGILIDFIIKNHPAYGMAIKNAKTKTIYLYLNERLVEISKRRNVSVTELTKDLHVFSDYHGNRTPIADPNLKGMISGLTMSNDEDDLTLTYLAFIQALAYGTRHIFETLVKNNRPPFESLLLCGGLSRNELFVQTLADVCSIPVLLPVEKEVVLVGASILGACAAHMYPDLITASMSMGGRSVVVSPEKNTSSYHEKKYKIFLKMLEHQREYENIMK